MIQKVLSKWNPEMCCAYICQPHAPEVRSRQLLSTASHSESGMREACVQLGAWVRARARYKEKPYFFLECTLYAYLYWGNQLFLLTSQEEEPVLAPVPGQSYTSQLAPFQGSQLSISILEEQLWQSPWPCLESPFPFLSQTKWIWNGWVNLTFFLWGTCVHMRGAGSPGDSPRALCLESIYLPPQCWQSAVRSGACTWVGERSGASSLRNAWKTWGCLAWKRENSGRSWDCLNELLAWEKFILE